MKKRGERKSKSLLISGAVIAVLVFGAGNAFGLDLFKKSQSDMSMMNTDQMAQDFAQRFDLNQQEVQDFFEQQKQQMMQQWQEKSQMSQEEMLSRAVEEGKITEEQKSQLQEELRNVSGDIQERMREFQSWAQDQGINLSELGDVMTQ